MKKAILALLLFLSLQSRAQQQWIAQGSVWHYSNWNIMESGLYELSYNTDTIIEGKTCQKIESKQWYFNQILPPPNPPTVTGPTLSSFFTYSANDTVFFKTNAGFKPMYIFTANIGDEWPAFDITDTCCNCTNVNLKVYNKGDTLIQGQTLRWIDLGPADSSAAGFALSTYINRVIEGIGNTGGSLIPSRSNFCYPTDTTIIVEQTYSEFRCFYSPTLSLNRFADCDGILAVGDIAADINRFTIFPNPSQGIININPANLANGYNLTVCDITGRQLQVVNGLKGNYQLQTDALPKALYTIRIEQAGKLYYHKLLIN